MNRPSVIPEGLTLDGAIDGEGDLLIYGRVHGPVQLSGTVIVECEGVLDGEVRGRVIVIRGQLRGDAYATTLIQIESTARVIGNATGPSVQVEDGARLRGQIRMDGKALPRVGDRPPPLRMPKLGRVKGERRV